MAAFIAMVIVLGLIAGWFLLVRPAYNRQRFELWQRQQEMQDARMRHDGAVFRQGWEQGQ